MPYSLLRLKSRLRLLTLCGAAAGAIVMLYPSAALAQARPGYQYKVLSTSKTSTMEKELNEAAEAGYRFEAVMGGDTAIGGSEVVAMVSRSSGAKPRFSYKLLATSKTSTMQRELQEAADAGFEYRGQTIFKAVFGGDEVVCILERDKDSTEPHSTYKLIATSKTSTLEKEANEAGAAGYHVVGMTVAKTAIGGKEAVVIARRALDR